MPRKQSDVRLVFFSFFLLGGRELGFCGFSVLGGEVGSRIHVTMNLFYRPEILHPDGARARKFFLPKIPDGDMRVFMGPALKI